jgi:hypothetical protein
MNSISRLIGSIGILLVGTCVYANAAPPSASSPEASSPQPTIEQLGQKVGGTPDCKTATSLSSGEAEVCKLQLQRDQYQLEVQKLDDQRAVSVQTAWALVVSALLGFGTIVFNLKIANDQARLQAKLKALEVVTSASGPKSGQQRLAVVRKLLGTEMFPEPDEMVIEGVGTGHDESRRTLLKLLAEHPGHRPEILDDWSVVFRDSKLSPNIQALQNAKLTSGSGHPTASPHTRHP